MGKEQKTIPIKFHYYSLEFMPYTSMIGEFSSTNILMKVIT